MADGNGFLGLNKGFILSADNGLTETSNNVQLGGTLLHDTNIDLAGANLSFSGQGPFGENHVMVGIDDVNNLSPYMAKLEVHQDSGEDEEVAVYGKANTLLSTGGVFEGGHYGVKGIAQHDDLFDRIGVYGEASGPATGTGNFNYDNYGGQFWAGQATTSFAKHNYGVWAAASGGDNSYGGFFEGNRKNQDGLSVGVRAVANDNFSTSNPITTNYGVYTLAKSSSSNSECYGIYAEAKGNLSYGIYATVVGSNGAVVGAPHYAGFFAGDVEVTGTFTHPSDNALKRQVTTLDSGMYIINQLRPVSFKFKRNQYPQMNLAKGKQYGLIAQEVQQVLPALVQESTHPAVKDSLGNVVHPQIDYKTVNYTELIPYLIKGMQEQQERMDLQQAQIDSLLTQVAILSSNTGSGNARMASGNGRTSVELSNQAIVLDQNVPNPFAERTSITYTLPEKYHSALMLFHDNSGRLVKSVTLTDKGAGVLDVYAHNLSNGIYTYTLVVDGAVIDTKRMVHNK